MKIAIIMNAQRLTPELADKLKSDELTKKYNIQYDLFIKEPQEIESCLKSLNPESYNAYLVGGGDGTVRTIVQHLLTTPVPLAILPLGTFNLFAKSLNYPNDIELLFDMIKNNKTKMIDIAQVNNHIIINHAWIGFYYHLLKSRKKHKNILRNNKFFKVIFNMANLFKKMPVYTLEVKTDTESSIHKTCLIFIGNNESSTRFLDFGEHKSLTSGLLSVTILNCTTRWELFFCFIQMMFKDLKDIQKITEFKVDNLTILSQLNRVNTVIDGELFTLEQPLNFKIYQKILTVVIP